MLFFEKMSKEQKVEVLERIRNLEEVKEFAIDWDEAHRISYISNFRNIRKLNYYVEAYINYKHPRINFIIDSETFKIKEVTARGFTPEYQRHIKELNKRYKLN